jgi:hypothetical protein
VITQDEDNLREALRYSAQMLGELRTSFLTPQKYYELYMQVFDELVNLEVGVALFLIIILCLPWQGWAVGCGGKV